MKRTDYQIKRVCYEVTELDNGKKINGVLVFVKPGIKKPWNDAKATGQKEIEKATGVKPSYLSLRTSLFERGHLYEFPGREMFLTSREIEEELNKQNGISQFPEEFEKVVKATPTDYEDSNVIDRANKKALRVIFWVFLIGLSVAALVIYFSN